MAAKKTTPLNEMGDSITLEMGDYYVLVNDLGGVIISPFGNRDEGVFIDGDSWPLVLDAVEKLRPLIVKEAS